MTQEMTIVTLIVGAVLVLVFIESYIPHKSAPVVNDPVVTTAAPAELFVALKRFPLTNRTPK